MKKGQHVLNVAPLTPLAVELEVNGQHKEEENPYPLNKSPYSEAPL